MINNYAAKTDDFPPARGSHCPNDLRPGKPGNSIRRNQQNRMETRLKFPRIQVNPADTSISFPPRFWPSQNDVSPRGRAHLNPAPAAPTAPRWDRHHPSASRSLPWPWLPAQVYSQVVGPCRDAPRANGRISVYVHGICRPDGAGLIMALYYQSVASGAGRMARTRQATCLPAPLGAEYL
jgi:hypothetical protein